MYSNDIIMHNLDVKLESTEIWKKLQAFCFYLLLLFTLHAINVLFCFLRLGLDIVSR